MATNALTGQGTRVLVDDGAGGNWGPVSEVVRFESNIISPQPQYLDLSHFLTDPLGKDEIRTHFENEDIVFEINYHPEDGTHDHITGLIKAHIDDLVWGVRIAPGGVTVGIATTSRISVSTLAFDRRTPYKASVRARPQTWSMLRYTPGVDGW